MSEASLYGLVAEFDDPTRLIEAAQTVKDKGYRRMEAYTPYPLKELDNIIKIDKFFPGFNPLPALILGGGLTGAAFAWALQYYIAAIEYPLNVGGRPLNSWPSFIIIMFELTILFAGTAAFLGSLLLSGLPRPNFPLFNLPRFAAASQDRFFLCIEARDAVFRLDRTSELLESLSPVEVFQVEE